MGAFRSPGRDILKPPTVNDPLMGTRWPWAAAWVGRTFGSSRDTHTFSMVASSTSPAASMAMLCAEVASIVAMVCACWRIVASVGLWVSASAARTSFSQSATYSLSAFVVNAPVRSWKSERTLFLAFAMSASAQPFCPN